MTTLKESGTAFDNITAKEVAIWVAEICKRHSQARVYSFDEKITGFVWQLLPLYIMTGELWRATQDGPNSIWEYNTFERAYNLAPPNIQDELQTIMSYWKSRVFKDPDGLILLGNDDDDKIKTADAKNDLVEALSSAFGGGGYEY